MSQSRVIDVLGVDEELLRIDGTSEGPFCLHCEETARKRFPIVYSLNFRMNCKDETRIRRLLGSRGRVEAHDEFVAVEVRCCFSHSRFLAVICSVAKAKELVHANDLKLHPYDEEEHEEDPKESSAIG